MPENRGAGAAVRRVGQGLLDIGRRELTGARNAIPGTSGWSPWQTLDAVVPGNWYDSQAQPGQRFQIPGADAVRRAGGFLSGLFNRGPGANEWGPPESLAGPGPMGPPSELSGYQYYSPTHMGPPTSGQNNRTRANTGTGRFSREIAMPIGGDDAVGYGLITGNMVNPSRNNPTHRPK